MFLVLDIIDVKYIIIVNQLWNCIKFKFKYLSEKKMQQLTYFCFFTFIPFDIENHLIDIEKNFTSCKTASMQHILTVFKSKKNPYEALPIYIDPVFVSAKNK